MATGRAEEEARRGLVRAAFRLEAATLAWMTLEAVIGIGAGAAAGSLSLTAFGLDSVIELASALVLIWRLDAELRRGGEFPESTEHAARRIAGALLFALAFYVVVSAGWALWQGQGQQFSWPGLLVALLAMPVMYFLARRKRALADKIGSGALRADAAESTACLWLSFVVVLGLSAQALFGVWWIDSATALAIVWFLVREGREAWEDEGGAEEEDEA